MPSRAYSPILCARSANSPVAWGGQRYFGDDALKKWIEEYWPDIVMSGIETANTIIAPSNPAEKNPTIAWPYG